MKYSVSSATPVAPSPVEPTAHCVTWQDAFEEMEFNHVFDRLSAKKLATDLEANEVFNNLTVAQIMKASGTLESLGSEAMSDMSKTFGYSIEELKAMSVESFIELTDKFMPKDADASLEVTGVELGIVIIFIAFLADIVGAIASSTKMRKYYSWLDKYDQATIKKIFAEKGQKALSEIMISCFDQQEFAQQIKACNAITKFLSVDMKKIYDPKFKIVDIEKVATALWSAPTGTVVTSDSKDTYTGVNEWFQSWTDNYPECKMKTLGAHGFTADNLKSTYDELKDMCNELCHLREIYADIKNGHIEAKKAIKPGFWQSIKLFFTEKEADREKRKQAELILNAKFVAMKNLLHGYDWCVRNMVSQFFAIAVKTDKYVTSDK